MGRKERFPEAYRADDTAGSLGGRNRLRLVRIPARNGFTPAICASRVSLRTRVGARAGNRASRAAPDFRARRQPDQGGGSVYGSDASAQKEAAVSEDAPAADRPQSSGARAGPAAAGRAQPSERGDRVRQPEGRRRQDDDDAQPRGRFRREGAPRAGGRHGPAGQPDDEPGDRPGLGREVDVRRARQQHVDPRGDPQAGGGRRLRLDRPRRRGDRDEHEDRPRALAREGAAGRCSRTTTSSASTRRPRWAC